MNELRTWLRHCITRCWHFSLAAVLFAAIASPAGAQTTNFTEIYNSGVLTLGADESLRLTIANNNNVSDPAVPTVPAGETSCIVLAQFLDGGGAVLQKEQQTLQPGQNFSLSVSGQQTVQARVDVSPGTSSGFARIIAAQCTVSNEIVNTESSDAARFPPLALSLVSGSPLQCRQQCRSDCSKRCQKTPGCFSLCLSPCQDECEEP